MAANNLAVKVFCDSNQTSWKLRQMIKKRRNQKRKQMYILMFLIKRNREAFVKAALMTVFTMYNAQTNNNLRLPRSCRRLIRNSGWWDKVWNQYSEKRFKRTFRVTRATFIYILSRIKHDIEKETLTEDPICPELRLAICLYRLGKGDCYREINTRVSRVLHNCN